MGRIALLVACALAFGACSAPATPAAAGAPGARATYILANPAGLLALDGNGRMLGRIVDLPANSAPATPTLHPTGKALAFAITLLPGRNGFGSDIYVVNLDGSGLRPLIEHEADTVFYATPLFDGTGNILFVHRRAPVVKNGSSIGNDDAILRVDLRTGERKTVVADGADPALSPDGRTIDYVHINKDGAGDALWSVGVDGANPHPLLAGRHSFYYLQSPRFSRSGAKIALSAAGHTAAATGGGRLAHLGVPSELFVLNADGSDFTRVGQTGDDVTPAWSPDGTRLAYIGTGAFFVLTLADGSVRSLVQGNEFFFGDLIWVK